MDEWTDDCVDGCTGQQCVNVECNWKGEAVSRLEKWKSASVQFSGGWQDDINDVQIGCNCAMLLTCQY